MDAAETRHGAAKRDALRGPGRRRALILMLASLPLLSSCGGGGGGTVPVTFAPLRYDYLTPIRLNVATLDIAQPWTAAPDSGDLGQRSPVPPTEALRQMATDRILPTGTAGHAIFTIEDASLRKVGNTYAGNWLVRLEVAADANAGASPSAFIEVNVTRRRGPASDDPAERSQALYDLVKQMMETMNVEFEYRVRHDLRSWLAAAPAAAPVEQQNLAPPPDVPTAPQALPPAAAPAPVPVPGTALAPEPP